jgi:hypothetical protein
MKNVYDLFVKSDEVNRIVKHYASKISWRYRTIWDREDAVNEIWCRLLKHVNVYYKLGESVIDFSRKKVYSIYGNLSDAPKNDLNNELLERYCSFLFNVYTLGLKSSFRCEKELPQFVYDLTLQEQTLLLKKSFTEEIHCSMFLDQIETEIENYKKGSENSRHMAINIFRDLRKGHTIATASKNNNISESNASRLFKVYVRELVENSDNLSIETL